MATRCSAKTASGHPCKAWAVHDTDPPLCSAHGGGKRPVGAPPGNTNAVKHGFYSVDPDQVTINDAIADLTDKMRRLDRLMAQHEEQGNGQLAYLFAIYTQASSRLSRMLRDRRALSGEAADGIAGAIAQAMDELGTELGVDLT